MRKLMLSGLALLGAVHCSESATPDASTVDVNDATSEVAPDTTVDVSDATVPDSAIDRPAPDVTTDTTDAPPPDTTIDATPDVALDSGPDVVADVPFDAPVDVPFDTATPDGGAPRCESAGGRCVALVPGACADGLSANAEWYSCGGGLGVMCCLPTTTPPSCRAIGSRSEGWYRANGELMCFARCAGASATCANVGTRSEGWYADVASAGCSDPPVERLIQWTRCSP